MSLKNIKKGDSVILKGFTGIKLGVFEVFKVTDKTITVKKKDGNLMIFSKKTGKQTNMDEGKEKYANSIMEDDGSYVKPRTGGNRKGKGKTAKGKKEKEPVETAEAVENDEDDFEELDEDDDFEELEED